ncbi:helix-turn-helix domain-containing protein [Burkholderia stagnalis]|uniref:helix-turn-helix domain-containing protein n=1 Tax=Burkholderia stagnalis TaxID=1503054 RepID=UPI000F5F5166|nr:helix-turn-helix domain-containing protein [Burkholderia stagnalis]RQX89622.1 helix-turn-helix domain-containing protein [Burkholderia stagnalis]
MKTTSEWLDALKARLALPSDYAVAKILGVTRQRVSSWRNGRATFEDDVAFRVAELLEINPLEVLVSNRAERSKSEDQRHAWEGRWEKFSRNFRSLVLPANARQTSICRV